MTGSDPEILLVDFAAPDPPAWRCIDDVVMGGVSRSTLRPSDDGTGVFSGILALEHGGGFASARAGIGLRDLSAHEGLRIRALGDGKSYRLRLFTEDGTDAVAYQAGFDTPAGRWRETFLPFGSFEPTFRGRRPAGAGPLDPRQVRQLGIMIADRQAGPFRLEIAWISAGSGDHSATLGHPTA